MLSSRPSDSSERPNFLRQFLAESTLSTDIDTEGSKDDGSLPKVTISTCHAAKGLEWPVVFVAAVEEGVFPFYLCTEPEQVQEERRLLYVAMTRAKGLLYLSHSAQRMRGAESHSQCVSRFVEKLKVSRTNVLCGDSEFSQSPPHINDQVRSELSAVIGRPVVDRKTIDRAVHTYQETEKTFPLSHDAVAQSSSSFSTLQRVNVGQNRWSATRSPPPLGRFSSAKQTAASQAAGQYAHTQQSQGGFTSAYMHSRGVPTPALGKVNASSVRQPFIPQIPRGNMGNKHLPLASASSHPPRTNRYELDDFKKMSAGFVSDLKRQIPEDEPVALNPTDPQPVTGKIKKSSGNEVKPVISLLETETHRSLISKDVEPMKRRIGIGRPGQTHKKSKP